MKCRYCRELSDYQVGLLKAPERAALEQHLRECACCREELAALQRTAELLRPMPVADAPRETWQHVQARLTPRKQHHHVPARYWVPAAAAVLLLLVVTMSLVVPLLNGGGALPVADDGYAQVQLAADWGSPLADKAALGLAMLEMEQDHPRIEEAVY
ncbi:MAG: hypothetical protein ABFD96_16175 [Armatimonadia bacterium]